MKTTFLPALGLLCAAPVSHAAIVAVGGSGQFSSNTLQLIPSLGSDGIELVVREHDYSALPTGLAFDVSTGSYEAHTSEGVVRGTNLSAEVRNYAPVIDDRGRQQEQQGRQQGEPTPQANGAIYVPGGYGYPDYENPFYDPNTISLVHLSENSTDWRNWESSVSVGFAENFSASVGDNYIFGWRFSPDGQDYYHGWTQIRIGSVEHVQSYVNTTPNEGIALGAIPEPSVAVLGMMGSLGLLRRRR